jgi:tRNA (adenine22-N1)-methyltransferase
LSPAIFIIMSVHLSARLAAVAACVPAGARLIDVGTDHAQLPVWLVQTGRVTHAWASDVRPGPLESAARLVAETETGDRISLCRTDGLQGFGPADGDTITIAGMGGETMVSILSAAPWTKKDTLLVLAPQSKQAVLRRWLCDSGYTVQTEALVQDAGRIYPIMQVRGGASPDYSLAELHTGLYHQIAQEPLFGLYLEQLMVRARSAAPYDAQALVLLAELENMKERLSS